MIPQEGRRPAGPVRRRSFEPRDELSGIGPLLPCRAWISPRTARIGRRDLDAADTEALVGPAAEPPDDEAFDRPPPAPERRRSRYTAAILDALIPGLGHLLAGRRLRALLFVSPLLVMVATAAPDRGHHVAGPRLAATLLSAEVIWGLLAAQALLLASRLHRGRIEPVRPGLAAARSRRPAPDRGAPGVRDRPAGVRRVCDRGRPRDRRRDLRRAGPGGRSPPPNPSRSPTRASCRRRHRAHPSSPSAAPTGRITGLIIGVDSGVGRNTYLTDTMIVVSLDPATRTVSMISIPRDMVDVPMPDGRSYRDKINSLVSYARRNPAAVSRLGRDRLRRADGRPRLAPGHADRLLRQGRPRRLRARGGQPRRRRRQRGQGVLRSVATTSTGSRAGFSITAGRHHLNGQQALAYARVRKASGRERLHPGRAPAGGHLRHPRFDRPRRVPQRPDRAVAGGRQDGRDQHPARPAAGPRRAGRRDRPGTDLSNGRQPAPRAVRIRRPRLDPDPRRRRGSGRLPPSCSRPTARCPTRRTALPSPRPARSRAAASVAAPRRPDPSRRRPRSPSRRRPLAASPTPDASATPEPERARSIAVGRASPAARPIRPRPRHRPVHRPDGGLGSAPVTGPFRATSARTSPRRSTTGWSAASASSGRATCRRARSRSGSRWSSVNYKDGLATRRRRQGRADQPADPRDRPGRRGRRQRRPRRSPSATGARPRLRPGRVAPRRLQRVPARPGRLGRAPRAGALAARRDGDRDGRVHRRDVRRRARGSRSPAGRRARCW